MSSPRSCGWSKLHAGPHQLEHRPVGIPDRLREPARSDAVADRAHDGAAGRRVVAHRAGVNGDEVGGQLARLAGQRALHAHDAGRHVDHARELVELDRALAAPALRAGVTMATRQPRSASSSAALTASQNPPPSSTTTARSPAGLTPASTSQTETPNGGFTAAAPVAAIIASKPSLSASSPRR